MGSTVVEAAARTLLLASVATASVEGVYPALLPMLFKLCNKADFKPASSFANK